MYVCGYASPEALKYADLYMELNVSGVQRFEYAPSTGDSVYLIPTLTCCVLYVQKLPLVM